MNAKTALPLLALLLIAALTGVAAGAGNGHRVPQTKITSVRIDDPPGTARLAFEGGGGVGGVLRFECSLDGGQFRTCSSPRKYRRLAAGRHRFRVRAVTGGTPDPTPASRKFRIAPAAGSPPAFDSMPPTTTIDSGPTGAIAEHWPTFTFHADEPASFECSTATGAPAFSPCASPYQPTVALADGPHTFEVRATDAAGNVGSPAEREFTVDTQPPVVTIAEGPSGATNDSTPTFAFSSSEAGSPQCRVGLQGSPPPSFAPCAVNFTPASPLGDGAYTFEVRATDAAGNAGSDSRSFTVDTQPPVVTITGGPNGATSDSTPTFAFTSSEAGSQQCRVELQGSPPPFFAPCAVDFTPASPLGDGAYTFEVRATDAAGNVGSNSRSFTVDTSPPVVGFDSVPPNPSSSSESEFTFHSTDATATFTCSLNGAAFAPCASPSTVSGVHAMNNSYAVRATDAAGNVGQATYTWMIN